MDEWLWLFGNGVRPGDRQVRFDDRTVHARGKTFERHQLVIPPGQNVSRAFRPDPGKTRSDPVRAVFDPAVSAFGSDTGIEAPILPPRIFYQPRTAGVVPTDDRHEMSCSDIARGLVVIVVVDIAVLVRSGVISEGPARIDPRRQRT